MVKFPRTKKEQVHIDRSYGKPILIRKGDADKPKIVDPEKERKKQKKAHMKQMMQEYKIKEAERKAKEAARKKKQWDMVKQTLKKTQRTSKETMFDMSDLLGSGHTHKKQSTKGKKNFVIRGGIAYPIAKKKKKKKKKEGDFNWKDFGMPSWKDMME